MKSLKEVLDICNATEDEGYENLFKIMEPSDERDEMGSIYEEALGYNPITYFDVKDIEKLIEDVESNDVREMINEHKDEIIETALEMKQDSLVDIFGNAVMLVLDINEFKVGDTLVTKIDSCDSDGASIEGALIEHPAENIDEEDGSDDDYED